VKRTATVLLCAAACALPTPAWADDETTVGCGDVITKSIKLVNDLNCTGIGLEVGAPKITIDLNGHTIAGNGGPKATFGIKNGPGGMSGTGHSGVEIKNGTVTGFLRGIRLGAGADRNRVERIRATGNFVGIDAEGVDRVRVSDSGTRNGGIGIGLSSVTNARVERNAALNNTLGIDLVGTSTGTLLRRNRAVNNTVGINVDSSATATRIENNDANINGDDGIEVDATDAATVIKSNRAHRNVDFGIEAAVGVTDGGGNRASGNGNPAQCSANISCAP
jgi:parallel beta-helix repeat protein